MVRRSFSSEAIDSYDDADSIEAGLEADLDACLRLDFLAALMASVRQPGRGGNVCRSRPEGSGSRALFGGSAEVRAISQTRAQYRRGACNARRHLFQAARI